MFRMAIFSLGTSREHGNITIELALVLPLLLFVVAGTVDLGLLYWEKHILTNATREGARAVIKAVDTNTGVKAEKTQAQIMQVVQDYLNRFSLRDLNGSNLVLDGNNFSIPGPPTVRGPLLRWP